MAGWWSSAAGCRVELCHEFPVGGACGGEVLVAFVELEAQVDDALLEGGVLLLERVDVGGRAEPGFPPCVFAEQAGEPVFEVLEAGCQAGGPLLGVEQVGVQGSVARGGPVPGAGGA